MPSSSNKKTSSVSKETKQQFMDKVGIKGSTAKKVIEEDSDDFE